MRVRQALQALGCAMAAAAVVLALTGAATGAGSPSVVISQVYGGGGNSGATYKNDFVELFNRGSTTVSLTGWSVQYAAAAGTTWSRTDLTGSIAPGHYYLVQEAVGAGGTVDLPDPRRLGHDRDVGDGRQGRAAEHEHDRHLRQRRAHRRRTRSTSPASARTATCFEGTAPTAATSNTTAALRKNAGCTDTDDNASDFAIGAPTPRNTASPTTSCAADVAPSVASTVPANGASGVPVGSNVSITFSEPVNVTGSWYSISCSASGTHTATVSGGPTTFTLDPGSDFSQGETCTVTSSRPT